MRTEFSAALSIKVRLGALMLEQRVAPVDELARLFDHSIVSIPIETTTFRAAARLAERHQHDLRAGDALHLAAAALARATICTLDQRLAKAADGLGLQNRLL